MMKICILSIPDTQQETRLFQKAARARRVSRRARVAKSKIQNGITLLSDCCAAMSPIEHQVAIDVILRK